MPGLLILGLMMLMFTAAGALIREKDKGTLIRLRLSNLRVFEWLAAVSATQVIVGILSALALTYLTALALGYRANGSLLVLLRGGRPDEPLHHGLQRLVAAFLRTVFDLVTVGCFPFFILMFFSGGMFPLPGVPLFQLGERTVELNEVLPTTHAITALNRVLSYGAGMGDIAYELGAMVLLTVAFFAAGTWFSPAATCRRWGEKVSRLPPGVRMYAFNVMKRYQSRRVFVVVERRGFSCPQKGGSGRDISHGREPGLR